METDQLKCSSCGHVMNLSEAAGVWIECPRCHARFMIDYSPGTGETDDNEKFKEVYYFSTQCDYQSFRTKCFDMMMQQSPADIFSELRVVEEKQCYLPYVSSIGGNSNSTYTAVYVGTDNHTVISQKYAQLSYKNSDARFGVFCRSHDKGNRNLETVSIGDASIAALPMWAAHADELHYYPFYCLACSYKGTHYSFSSLGDCNINVSGMPVDGNLHRKPHLIKLSNSERISYATLGAGIAVVIIALCLLLIFWQDVTGLITDEKAFLTEHWKISHERNGWFAYILITIYLFWLFLKGAFFLVVGGGITFCISFCISFCIMWLAIVIGVFLRNRYVVHRCLTNLKKTQHRKRQEAFVRFAVYLKELYDKEKTCNNRF